MNTSFCVLLSFTTKAAPMSSIDHGGGKRRQRHDRKIRPAGCNGFAIWRLVIGPVAQSVPKTRTTPATKTVANAAMSVCANVHIETALKPVIKGVSTAARREWPNP